MDDLEMENKQIELEELKKKQEDKKKAYQSLLGFSNNYHNYKQELDDEIDNLKRGMIYSFF